MADDADIAHELETRLRDAAIASARKSDGADSPDCVICGDEIPLARREAVGNGHCFDCAQSLEAIRIRQRRAF